MKIIFIRHGQTDFNVKSKTGEVMTSNNPQLNETGRAQARATGEKLKSWAVDKIYSSPLDRAVETANLVFSGRELVISEGFRERLLGEVSSTELDDLFNFEKDRPAPGRESLKDFFERVYTALDELVEGSEETVAVVAHGGVFHAFEWYFGQKSWDGPTRTTRLENGDYKIYEI